MHIKCYERRKVKHVYLKISINTFHKYLKLDSFPVLDLDFIIAVCRQTSVSADSIDLPC